MDIAAWLGGLGLGQYEQSFRNNDIDGEVLRGLTADDLRELGVAWVGFFGEAGIRRVRRGARSAASTPTASARRRSGEGAVIPTRPRHPNAKSLRCEPAGRRVHV